MTLANAIKKLTAAGFEVTCKCERGGFMTATNKNCRDCINFVVINDKVTCIEICEGVWFDSISQVLRYFRASGQLN